jgi:hypothetical protein
MVVVSRSMSLPKRKRKAIKVSSLMVVVTRSMSLPKLKRKAIKVSSLMVVVAMSQMKVPMKRKKMSLPKRKAINLMVVVTRSQLTMTTIAMSMKETLNIALTQG